MSKTIKVGLIRGRHEMPVDRYIINKEVEDVLDFESIRKIVWDFVSENCEVKTTYGCAVNQCDNTDIEIFKSDVNLEVYVTGLTSVTAEVIRACAMNGVGLILMHYDRESGCYKPQKLF